MKPLITLLIVFMSFCIFSQDDQLQINTFESQKSETSEGVRNSKQYQRKQWYLEQRLDENGNVPNIDKLNYEAFKSYKRAHPELEQKRNAHGSWTFLGPNDTNVGGLQGRVNSIDIHPTNDQIIYVCTPNGGIWKTTNGGSSWTPLTDHLALNSFADLELSPTNPNVIYALSGDGDPAVPPSAFHTQTEVISIGVFKSIDAGNSWSFVSPNLPSNLIPLKLLIHPANPNIQFIASNNGIYKTTDAWQTNQLVHTPITYDIEFKPGDPSIMYASGVDIYRSTLNGNLSTWDKIEDSDFDLLPSATRIELAVTPDYPTYVAAIAGNWTEGSKGVYVSYFEGMDNLWTLTDSSTNIISNFAHYCIGLAIDPDDFNVFYGGGVPLFKSTNEGFTGTWSQVGNGVVHADIHDIQIKNGTVYVGSDGGIFKSTDGGASWTDLSAGLGISEIYRMSGIETNAEKYFIGTQDNGIQRRTAGTNFHFGTGGDGAENIIDYTNENIVYAMWQNGGFFKSTNGGNSFSSIAVPSGGGAWITPMIMDPSNHNLLFIGKDTVFRSIVGGIGGSWLNIGSPSPGNLNNLAQGTNNRNVLYASQFGQIYRTDNALANPSSAVNWSTLSGLPNIFITDIVVDPNNSSHAFVTMGSFIAGLKVYETINAGSSWNNISGSLPNIPILSIAYHNDGNNLDRMYIGTDIGVFYRDDNIGDWIYFSNFLPTVPVTDLYINHTAGTIAAGTYGRGLWRSNLISNCPNSLTHNSSITLDGVIHYSYNNSIISSATIGSDPGTSIFYNSGGYIDLKPDFLAPQTSLFEAKIGPCPY